MMTIRSTFLAVLLGAASVAAHAELFWPHPLHSKYNPITPEALKDYSMTSPLVTDGPWPCKGFINNPVSQMVPTVTWSAGKTYNYTTVVTAPHGGGSVQLSLSYDNGTTWSVIFSYMGGANIEGNTIDFLLPADAPSGTGLFAWTWFNLQGNREMYEDCAVIDVIDGGAGLNSVDYPAPFVANANVNNCTTIENINVVFPNPGKNVRYGGVYKDTKPTTPAGFTGTNCVAPGAGSGGSGGTNTSSTVIPSSTSANTSSPTIVPSQSPTSSINSSQSPTPSFNSSSQSPAPSANDTETSTRPSSTLWSGSSLAAVALPTKTCTRKQQPMIATQAVERRHERLLRRARHGRRDSPKRVAAGKVLHNGR